MRRALLLLLAVIAATWLEYEFFPGHTYLEKDTQLYLPILERLDTPGFLSRDLVATHPNVSYTIYDELTLFLHEAAHLNFRTALTAQQLVCRAAAFLGIFLLALSCGLPDLQAFAVAFVVNLGALLPGPAVSLVDPEPVPYTFAFGLILLAIGLLANEKPLLAGLAAGVALIYDAPIAAPFWSLVILGLLFDARLRQLVRPALTVFIVFLLLLANLAQLQPGVVESQHLLSQISAPFAQLQQNQTPFAWLPAWAKQDFWIYAALLVLSLWATTRIWPKLNRQTRWCFVAFPLCGLLTIPVTDLLLDRFHWSFLTQLQPARILLYTVALTSTTCAMAAWQAFATKKKLEAGLWMAVVLAIPINPNLLDLLHPAAWIHASQFAHLHRSHAAAANNASVADLAAWAERNTWGSSMFLFPDAGHELYPGVFRADSRRALWVDWQSRRLTPFFESFAFEWQSRWQNTMDAHFSPARLERMLPLPIDYYALKNENRLQNVKPVFQNNEFVVYDANDLKNANPLRLAALARN